VTTRKGLQHHRTHRTPIKLQCFAVNEASGAEQKVGFIMLDLRTATAGGGGAAAAEWVTVSNTQYSKARPDLKLSLEVEMPTSQPQPAAAPKQLSPKRTPLRRPRPQQQQQQHQRDAGNDGGAGPAVVRPTTTHSIVGGIVDVGDGEDMFTLTVTVGSATGLPALAADAADGDTDLSGVAHYFMYTFLGKEVSMDAMRVLADPLRLNQSSTIQLCGSWADVRSAMAATKSLRIFFLSDDECLVATAVIPLDHFFGAALQPPAGPIEGAFPLTPHSVDPASGDAPPSLTVRVAVEQASPPQGDSYPDNANSADLGHPTDGENPDHQPVEDDRPAGPRDPQELTDLINRVLESRQIGSVDDVDSTAGGGSDAPRPSRDRRDDRGAAVARDDRAGALPAWGTSTASETTETASEAYRRYEPPRRAGPVSSESDTATAAGDGAAAQPEAGWPETADTEKRAFCVTVDIRAIRALLVGPTLATVQVLVLHTLFPPQRCHVAQTSWKLI
jgi:hypothetical protein